MKRTIVCLVIGSSLLLTAAKCGDSGSTTPIHTILQHRTYKDNLSKTHYYVDCITGRTVDPQGNSSYTLDKREVSKAEYTTIKDGDSC